MVGSEPGYCRECNASVRATKADGPRQKDEEELEPSGGRTADRRGRTTYDGAAAMDHGGTPSSILFNAEGAEATEERSLSSRVEPPMNTDERLGGAALDSVYSVHSVVQTSGV